jgi:hypothetical protein
LSSLDAHNRDLLSRYTYCVPVWARQCTPETCFDTDPPLALFQRGNN